jgi:hypothetical protein
MVYFATALALFAEEDYEEVAARLTETLASWGAGTSRGPRRPRAGSQAAPLRPLPDGVTDLDHFRVRRRDRAGGAIHEYRLVA